VTGARAGCYTLAVPADAWNPQQYERFHAEREQPFRDLLGLVQPRPDMRIVDLGCGTGELTRELHLRVHAMETLGIDNSDAMLERARSAAVQGLRFERGDIGELGARNELDVVFSNAALHWVPDHPRLFAHLAEALTESGQLAVQMPANHDHPSHVVAAEVAAEEPFRAALGGYARSVPVLAPERYAELLEDLGFAEQHVRLQVYTHRLDRRDDVVEWVKGTLLTDYEKRLPAELFARFLERYRERLLPELRDRTPFLFPFKRILLWAQRPRS
jgi:trans-aconitate 2-methyltransferase